MSLFEEPGAELLIAAIILFTFALFIQVIIRRWQAKCLRQDKAFWSAPPMQED